MVRGFTQAAGALTTLARARYATTTQTSAACCLVRAARRDLTLSLSLSLSLQGKGFAVNVPLKDGIRDDPFLELFTEVIDSSVKNFNPDAIVMQCGAGSLAGDRVGSFNLTHVGHCKSLIISHVRSFCWPLHRTHDRFVLME